MHPQGALPRISVVSIGALIFDREGFHHSPKLIAIAYFARDRNARAARRHFVRTRIARSPRRDSPYQRTEMRRRTRNSTASKDATTAARDSRSMRRLIAGESDQSGK